jgi:four helix bundle protein
MKTSIVKEKSYTFALKIIQLYQLLRKQNEYALANQLIRAGTSIGANIEEALAGVSKPDYTLKMSIASKEARETQYWLRLLRDSKLLAQEEVKPMIQDVDELIRILTAIVKTCKTGCNKSTNSTLNTKN